MHVITLTVLSCSPNNSSDLPKHFGYYTDIQSTLNAKLVHACPQVNANAACTCTSGLNGPDIIPEQKSASDARTGKFGQECISSPMEDQVPFTQYQ